MSTYTTRRRNEIFSHRHRCGTKTPPFFGSLERFGTAHRRIEGKTLGPFYVLLDFVCDWRGVVPKPRKGSGNGARTVRETRDSVWQIQDGHWDGQGPLLSRLSSGLGRDGRCPDVGWPSAGWSRPRQGMPKRNVAFWWTDDVPVPLASWLLVAVNLVAPARSNPPPCM